MRTARPPNSAASFSARSTERLATSTVFAPRLARCFTQASPILPAPKIITVLSLRLRSKTFSANSTATLPTEVAPRPMAVLVRIFFTTWQARLEQAVHFLAGQSRVLRRLIRIFDLAGDFRFADDHRIQSAGDGKKMFGRFRAFLDVEMRREIKIAVRQFLEKLLNAAVNPRRHAVDFHAVARREQHYFGKIAAQL